MPEAEDTQAIVELTHHSLHALRAVNGTVEAGGECVLENKGALEALLGAVAPAWKADGIKAAAAVWPDGAAWHFSTDTEAMLDRTGDSLRAIAATLRKDGGEPLTYAVCSAADGGPVTADGTEKWILACSPRASFEKAAGALAEHKVLSAGARPAAFARIGAISAALRQAGQGAVALWDLGTESSFLVLVTAAGVEGAVPCEIGLDAIFEAVQSALKLKFRGAGARLFFNEGYDFTEPGPRVGAIVGPKLKEALALLPQPGGAPALSCIGLTGKQAWFLREAAAAAGTTQWEPDLGKLAGELGLKFSDAAVAASFSPASAGLLGLLGSKAGAGGKWNPPWVSPEAPAAEAAPAPVAEPEREPEPEPAPVARPAAPPARIRPSISIEGSGTPAPSPAKSVRPVGSPKPVSAPQPPGAPAQPQWPVAPAAPARPQAPQPVPSFSRPSFDPPSPPGSDPMAAPSLPPAPAFAVKAPQKAGAPTRPHFEVPAQPPPAGADFPPPAVSIPPPPAAAAPAAQAGAKPTPAVTALPFEAAKVRAAAAPQEPPAPPKSKVGFYIGIGVAAASIFAAIMIVLEAHNDRARAYDLEQQEELAHHNAEQALKESEDARKLEAEQARKEMEAAIAITKKQTEDETRREVLAELEADRLAKLPGVIVLATSPAGALVSIDGAAPVKSPVKAEGIAPGTHHLQITLAGHDPVELDAVIKGSKTTDLGTVALASSVRGGRDREQPRRAGVRHPRGRRSHGQAREDRADTRGPGRHPARRLRRHVLASRVPRPHRRRCRWRRATKSSVSTKYQDGSLELTSDPSGAWVDKDGTRLGSTPLTLHDLTPKEADFLLTLPGYDPTPVKCEIPEGDTLKLEAMLLRRDRVFKPEEVKTLPVIVEAPQPALSAAQLKLGADVLIAFTVRRDGTVADVEVENATDDDIGRRCMAAVENWRYRPGTASDDRIVDVRLETRFKFPGSGS